MTRLLTLLLIFLSVNALFSQQTLTDTYTPSSNGYIMTVPFDFEFINCMGSEGVPHLSVSKETKNTSSNEYKYNGKIYTESELGAGSFSNMRKYVGQTDVKVDIYDGNGFLGTVTLTNVTGYGIGCQGQLYNVFKKLGINGKEYKERINALSVRNLRIIKIFNPDSGLHMKIDEYNKNKQVESLLHDANYSFDAGRYEEAANLCHKIKEIDYSNSSANAILEEIKNIKINEERKEAYDQYISKGHDYYDDKDFVNAKKEYQSALNTNVNNAFAQDRIWDAEKGEKAETESKEPEEETDLKDNKKDDEEDDEEEQKRIQKAKVATAAKKQKQKDDAAEARRKQAIETENRRKEKINEYNDRIEKQRRENNVIAASAAASSTSALFMLGGFIYSGMGLPANDLYTGNNFHVNLDFGFGLSSFPIAQSSETTSVDYYGDPYTSTNDDPGTAITVDLRLALKFGYEMEYAGGNLYGRFEPGFSPIFTSFNTSYSYGGEIFGGGKIIKLYGRYEIGSHNYTYNNWIDPEEIGEGGKSSTKYKQIRAGLKFSYYRNLRTAKRDHLVLGIIENHFDEDSAHIFSNRETHDESLLNIIETRPVFLATGYFFEWKRDHTHRLYIELFPNYPVTGEIGNSSSEGKFFIQAGFSRSIESFFGNK